MRRDRGYWVEPAGAVLAIAFAISAPAYAAPPGSTQQESRPDTWTREVHIIQTWYDPEKSDPFTIAGSSRQAWSGWITPEDIPADLRNRNLDTTSFIAVDIDTQGRPTNCHVAKASSDPRLDQIACRLLVNRGPFDIHYEAPGRPVPVKRIIAIIWENLDATGRAEREKRLRSNFPPAPPPPADSGGWPRLDYTERVAPVSLPLIQADYPASEGYPSEGTVSLDLAVSAASDITGCEIGISSGNSKLDQAACGVARRLDLHYTHMCDSCDDVGLPLQVVWRKHGSYLRLPLHSPYYTNSAAPPRDPADTRTATAYSPRPRLLGLALSRADFDKLADKSHTRPVVRVRLPIDRDGKTKGCTVEFSSGNPAIDQRMCDLVTARARFEPRTDVFGDPAAATDRIAIDLRSLL